MKNLPLDPPYFAENGHNWDALNDSLWGGLFNFPSEKILIIWKSAEKMKNNDISCFEIVCDMFSSLISSLSDEKKMENKKFQLVIIGILD